MHALLRNKCFGFAMPATKWPGLTPPRRGAMAVNISAREEKAANKEAEAVQASLSRVGEAAVAQALMISARP